MNKNSIIYYVGQTIGNCTFLRDAPPKTTPNSWNRRIGVFLCVCGNEFETDIYSVKKSLTVSCGCLTIEKRKKSVTKHGATIGYKTTKEFRAWCSMRTRCLNKKCKAYKNYGGRGIEVCQRWLQSFENFLEDMGLSPTDSHTLERNNNSLGYCKENCSWATKVQQSNNRRNSIKYEYRGLTKSLSEWAETLGKRRGLLYQRIHVIGMPIDAAFDLPIQKHRRKYKQKSITTN